MHVFLPEKWISYSTQLTYYLRIDFSHRWLGIEFSLAGKAVRRQSKNRGKRRVFFSQSRHYNGHNTYNYYPGLLWSSAPLWLKRRVVIIFRSLWMTGILFRGGGSKELIRSPWKISTTCTRNYGSRFAVTNGDIRRRVSAACYGSLTPSPGYQRDDLKWRPACSNKPTVDLHSTRIRQAVYI